MYNDEKLFNMMNKKQQHKITNKFEQIMETFRKEKFGPFECLKVKEQDENIIGGMIGYMEINEKKKNVTNIRNNTLDYTYLQ